MQPIVKIVGPLAAADADGICLSQTPLAAGALTINGALASGGVATIAVPSRITITSAGNDSTNTFVVVGTDYSGSRITETITGPNATAVTSVLTYRTVTSIAISAAAVGAITVGNAQSGASSWISLDPWAFPQVAIQCGVSGTVNYTVQQTLDNPNDPVNPVAAASVQWVDHPDANLVAATATKQGNYGYAPLYMRLVINSGSGTVRLSVIQANVVSA
jgi:VCBS repeat-containing protein